MELSRPKKLPETAEYIEKLVPENRDDTITYAGSIEFRFAQHSNSKGFTYPIPGIRTEQRLEYKIRSNEKLPFKAGDIIRFGNTDRRRYTVIAINYDGDDADTYRSTYLYPDDAEDTKYKILTLE